MDVELGGQKLSPDHVRGSIVLLLLAGIDTTWSAIGSSLWHLAAHPEDRRRLVAEPELMPTAIEELLRAYAPVTMARMVAQDHDFHGCPMKTDEWVLLPFPAANRDPELFDRADEVVIDRLENRHAAFGLGIHRCLGSNLARLELRVAVEEFLGRFPEFELADPDDVGWSVGQIRGPRRLPCASSPPESGPAVGAHGAGPSGTGSETVKRAPPPATLAAVRVPPWASTSWRAIVSPSPLPAGVGRGVEAVEEPLRVAAEPGSGRRSRRSTTPALVDGRRHVDLPAGRRVAHGVGEQVAEHLTDAHRIDVQLDVGPGDRRATLDLPAAPPTSAIAATASSTSTCERRTTRGAASAARRRRAPACGGPRRGGRACGSGRAAARGGRRRAGGSRRAGPRPRPAARSAASAARG